MAQKKVKIKLETTGTWAGWWVGRFHQFREKTPNGKWSQPPRKQLCRDDDWDMIWFIDDSGQQRKRSPNQKKEYRWGLYKQEEKRLQVKWDLKHPHTSKTDASRHTLGEAIDRFIEEIIPTKAESTQPGYRKMAQWWNDHYGDMTLEQMDSEKCFEAREDLRNEVITRNGNGKGKPRSDSRVNRYMSVLSSIFTACVKNFQFIKISFTYETHQFGKLKAPPNPASVLGTLEESSGRDRDSLTPAEIKRLLEACESNQKLYVATYLTLCSGARKDEIWSLKRDQIDWRKKEILLTKTKNKDNRTIHLVGDSYHHLLKLAQAEGWAPAGNIVYKEEPVGKLGARIWKDSPFVFPSRYDRNKSYNMIRPFDDALKASGISDFTWHDIRRTVCTHLLMARVPEEVIMKICGWKDRKMIARYLQASKEQVKEVQEKATVTYMPSKSTG